MPTVIGIDFGTRRVGLAIGDSECPIASPAATLDAGRTPADTAARVAGWAAEHRPVGIVVGLPLNMDGTDSDQTRLTRVFARSLEQAVACAVHLWDERLTSYQADQMMRAAQVRRGRQKRTRDALAAQVILQSWFDRQDAGKAEPGEASGGEE